MSAADRFWAKVKKTPTCWLWTAATSVNGRGQEKFRYGKFGLGVGKTVQAHRFSYELAAGEPIAPGLKCCHSCDNTLCVNPAHLFLGTNQDNMTDCVRKGRSSHGDRRYNAKLTPRTARAIRDYNLIPRDKKHGTTALGEKFGIAASTVSSIRSGSRWATALRAAEARA